MWEYSDKKRGELAEQAKTEFDSQKEKFIEKFTSNVNSIKKAFKDKQKDFRLDNSALNNAMFFISNIEKKKDTDFFIDSELIESIASEFIGDTRSLNIAVNLRKVAYKCGIALDDYEVHDEIGADTLVKRAMGLN